MNGGRRDRGVALVILMVVIIIATLLGVWGLSSSRIGILKAGSKSAQTRLQLLAEQGIQKALRRVQEIVNYDGTLGDSIGSLTRTSLTEPLTSGGVVCVPDPYNETAPCNSPGCPDIFNTNSTEFDQAHNSDTNVLCNFLGDTVPDTQVILVRKGDLIVSTTEWNAIYLVNSIAKDSANRRQVVQAVIIIPFDPTTGLALNEPYIATTVRSPLS